MLNGSIDGASEMVWICGRRRASNVSSARARARARGREGGSSSTHLADLELDVVDRARLDRLLGALHDGLDEHDRLVVDALDPAHHLLRHELGLDDDEALDRVVLLAQDDEHHLGACERVRRGGGVSAGARSFGLALEKGERDAP